jgi:hypothetical protein
MNSVFDLERQKYFGGSIVGLGKAAKQGVASLEALALQALQKREKERQQELLRQQRELAKRQTQGTVFVRPPEV